MASRAPGDPSADAPAAVGLWHVDVFSDRAMAGNGVAVVRTVHSLDPHTMLRIAQELRQFETIFVSEVTQQRAEARIFTPEEELAFAGHPMLGAAAVLHGESRTRAPETLWSLRVGGRTIPVTTRPRSEGVVWAEMDQGAADLRPPLAPETALAFAEALGLAPEHLRTDLPTQVVSTGLPYLLLPVTPAGLARSHVSVSDLPQRLAEVGADFVYVLDPDRPEGRTWDNRGITEDVATGSAAGPTAAYLFEHGLHPPGMPLQVHQGRFVGRPSRIDVRVASDGSVFVGGLVAPFSSGTISLDTTERASE